MLLGICILDFRIIRPSLFSFILLILLIILCRVFTIIFPKGTMFPGYIVQQLFASYNLLHVMLFPMLNVLYFYISNVLSKQYAPQVSNITAFCTSLISCFHLCYSGIL